MTKTFSFKEHQTWFALADSKRCRLFLTKLTEQGTQHVEERSAFENKLPEQEHARPETGGTSHYIEENERRFAHEIVEWLQRKAGEHKMDHLVLFAPARMLGALRKIAPGTLKGHFVELQGDLMRLDAGQLAEHPMIRDLLKPTLVS